MTRPIVEDTLELVIILSFIKKFRLTVENTIFLLKVYQYNDIIEKFILHSKGILSGFCLNRVGYERINSVFYRIFPIQRFSFTYRERNKEHS